MGVKRVLSSSDEDGGEEEKKGDSEGSTMGETSTPQCSPASGEVKTRTQKAKEKRRKRKERRKAATGESWIEEEDIPDFPFHYGWSGYFGTLC